MTSKERPKTRIFNGRKYRLHSGHKSKAGAKQSAERLRRQGYNARIVKDSIGTGWAVYRGLRKRERRMTDREAEAFFK